MKVKENKKNADDPGAIKSQKQFGKLKTFAKKGLAGRVGMKAHAMKKARKIIVTSKKWEFKKMCTIDAAL